MMDRDQLRELNRRAAISARRAELLMETLDLAARGYPEDYRQIEKLDKEIELITRELEVNRWTHSGFITTKAELV